MIEIRALIDLKITELERLASGYSSNAKYKVSLKDSKDRISIILQLVKLSEPYVKKYDHLDDETIERYNRVLKQNCSFGAYDGDLLVGAAVAETSLWNKTL